MTLRLAVVGGCITEAMLDAGVAGFSLKNYLARGLNLKDCLADAAAAGLPVYIDADATLPGDTTLPAPIIAAGGVITLCGYTVTGDIYGPALRLFDASATGSKVVQTAETPVEFGWLVSGIDDTTDVLNELNAAMGNGNQTIQLGARSIRAGDTWTIDVPLTVLTAGFDTIFTRGTASLYDKSQITIAASNVSLGSLAFTGNIANDTGEFCHCVNIVPDGADVSNVAIGDISGTDIRGDLAYVGGRANFGVSSVSIGNCIGANLYRNGVSVVGGVGIRVGDVTLGACGNAAVDVEPNTGSQIVDDVHFGRVSGSRVVVTSTDPAYGNVSVNFAEIDVDASAMINSSPGYPGYQTKYGFLQNYAQDVRIDCAHISNFSFANIYSAASGGNLSIGYLVASGTGTDTAPAIAGSGFSSLTVESGTLTVPTDGYLAIRVDSGPMNLWNLSTNGGCLFGVNSVWRNVTFTMSGTPANHAAYGAKGLDAIGVTYACSTAARYLFSGCANVRHLNCSVSGGCGFSDSGCSNFDGGQASPPASASASGQRGQWAIDTAYRYDCVADNSWQRSASASW